MYGRFANRPYWIDTPPVRPDLSWLAEVEDEPGLIAGFCLCSVYESGVGGRGSEPPDDPIPDPRPPTPGLDTALLGVDSESLTGAQHLYESVGFRIRDRELQYERQLDEMEA